MNREILRLAIPNILSNISVPLISSFDTALMGNLGGTHIAAVGLGSMAFNFVYWNFGFLRMGTTGLTAQAFGRGSLNGQAQSLLRGAVLALGIGLCLVLLQQPLVRFTEWLLNIRNDQLALVEEYFFIRILAAPAALLQMVLLGWFFGRQNAVWPLILTLAVNVANLGLSYYLVTQAEWGIAGVAWGTVAAQYFGLLLGIGFLVYGGLRSRNWPLTRKTADPRAAAPEEVSLGAFFRINRDIFIRTVCLTLSFAFFYNRANALDVGTATVAANVILLQLVNWLSYGVDGFAFAAESLVGKYAGAGDPVRLRRAIWRIMAWGMGLAVVYALTYWMGGRSLLQLFAPEASAAATLAVTLQYLPVLVLFCLLATPCYLLDGVFVGLTAARAMRQTMLLALAGYLGAYYLVGQYFGNYGLWGSLLFFMVLRAGMQWAWWRLGWVSELRSIEAG
ncbi:MATE family efflux transporter [Neolewinella litorea]|uniref:MATE family efflux transporter n=2 Tax=Neolewinella litorea TaxID=2562452 RepID=A0A4S4NHH4_9BACT|nr:MATE family efflux transporter [Neolewinella litorea]